MKCWNVWAGAWCARLLTLGRILTALSDGRRLEAPLKWMGWMMAGWGEAGGIGKGCCERTKVLEEKMQAGEGLEEMKVMMNIPRLPWEAPGAAKRLKWMEGAALPLNAKFSLGWLKSSIDFCSENNTFFTCFLPSPLFKMFTKIWLRFCECHLTHFQVLNNMFLSLKTAF